jgi:SAM-dependent methyltransferase
MPWYKHWFADELYMDLYAHRDVAEARQAIDMFEQSTNTGGTALTCLDLACGTGRHAYELARRGHRVFAADLSPALLAAARSMKEDITGQLLLLRADMRRLPFTSGSLDAVLQLFTAFGYFASDEANEAVIRGVRRTLSPGGWYMLDFLNAGHVRRTLIPRSETEVGEARVVQERHIENDRVEKRIRVLQDGRERIFEESVRLFTLDDFQRMFQNNGLAMAEVYGDYDGASYHEASPRCLMLARATK